jgi:hypothetical protein
MIRVADNEPINHMNAPNLAICVAPVIVTTSGPTSFAGTMESMGRAQALVRDLIIQCEWVFEKHEDVEEAEEVRKEEDKETANEEDLYVEEKISVAGDVEELTEMHPVVSI